MLRSAGAISSTVLHPRSPRSYIFTAARAVATSMLAVNWGLEISPDNSIKAGADCLQLKGYVDEENFYVIADYGDEVALIMDRNVGPKVAWISVEDYNKVNINNYLCGEYDACSYYGPITAVNSLKLNTEMWSNIIRREYTYEDEIGNMYERFTKTMRSRILTYTEATGLGCVPTNPGCPKYLYTNLVASYDSEIPHSYWIAVEGAVTGIYVDSVGGLYHGVISDGSFGSVRPVITLTSKLQERNKI